jgi:CRISPR/Cas system CMR subunit Cmr6 (Cas7 group RAMP superfamily)
MIYKIILKTLSDTLIGSGKSSGTIIDSDIVFDSHCLPYIPAKRIKDFP